MANHNVYLSKEDVQLIEMLIDHYTATYEGSLDFHKVNEDDGTNKKLDNLSIKLHSINKIKGSKKDILDRALEIANKYKEQGNI